MIAASFDESNIYFDIPDSMTYDECEPLSVYKGCDVNGQAIIISCWKPTREELEEILLTGRVWCFHYGEGLQPHALSGLNPFKLKEE